MFKMLIAAIVVASPVWADPLSFKDARKALPRDRAELTLAETDFLDEKSQTILKGLRDSIPYYGALALSPSEGLFVEWLQASGQHHSLSAAREAALKHCEANRKSSSDKCQIVLDVFPKGATEDTGFSLSAPAADALRKEYRKLKAPKAFAISKTTGNFGFDRGDGGRALAACASVADQATDCEIVVAD